jgi:hypothetical protein
VGQPPHPCSLGNCENSGEVANLSTTYRDAIVAANRTSKGETHVTQIDPRPLGYCCAWACHLGSRPELAAASAVAALLAPSAASTPAAALCRGDTPADVIESLIKELPRLIRLQNKVSRFRMSERPKSQALSDASYSHGVALRHVLPVAAHAVLAIDNLLETTSDRPVALSPGTGLFRRGRIIAGLPCG